MYIEIRIVSYIAGPCLLDGQRHKNQSRVYIGAFHGSIQKLSPKPAPELMCLGGKVKKGGPYSITERMVLELIPVLGSQPAGDASHKPSHYFPPGLQLPPQLLRGLLPILLLGEQRHDGCEQFA